VEADDEIRPKDEVIVVNENGEVLAVGRAVLSGEEMKAFKTGVAVKVRRGSLEES
jgi:predicted RNA-binding protein (TIGR00451 family)